MKTRRFPLLAIIFLPFLCCSCSLPGDSPWIGLHAEAAVVHSHFNFEGTADTEATSTLPISSVFHFGNEGGITGNKNLPYLKFSAGIAPLELRLTAFDYNTSSPGSFTGNFLGTEFTGDIASDLDLRSIRGTLGFDLLSSEHVRVAVVVGLNTFLVNLRVDDTTGSDAFRELDELLPVPVIGARGDIDLPLGTRVGAEVSIPVLDSVTDYEIGLVDVELTAQWSINENSELIIGTRRIGLFFDGVVENSPARVDLDLDGHFFGVSVTF
ncbi:MAG TPA: hypothetical protein EYN79_03980 [Planctomycetes bacterium]|nr:hypothetical protein [Planctomycetota bacterium]HIN81016.1 hypothetical protein [Planctomycetota bacterium]